MNEKRTHYQVMGLAPEATPEQVKKRFRELARKYHPDLHPDHPEYHEIFLRINQAYEVLNDAGRRASYDLTLRDQARREAERGGNAYGSAPAGSAGPRSGPASPGPRPGGGMPQQRAAGSPTRQQMEAERRRQHIMRTMEDARHAYSRGHLKDAQKLLEDLLQSYHIGAAHELLGDIYARQNRLEQAAHQYTLAAQLVANNGLIMAKLNQVMTRQGAGSLYSMPQRGMVSMGPSPATRLAHRAGVTLFGMALMLFLLLWWPRLEGGKLGWLLLANWTMPQLVFTSLNGLVCGMILSIAGWIRPFDVEMVYQAAGVQRRPVPMGLMLALFGSVFFPLAVVVYGVIAYVQDHASPSVLGVFGATLIMSAAFWTVVPSAQWDTICFTWNIVFIAMLGGWALGDLFRPSWTT